MKSENLIRREDALDAIDEIESEVADGDGFQCEKWRQYFCELPSADVPDRKVGKWIETKQWGGRNYYCSNCKYEFTVDTAMLKPMWNFCPECGSYNKGENDET